MNDRTGAKDTQLPNGLSRCAVGAGLLAKSVPPLLLPSAPSFLADAWAKSDFGLTLYEITVSSLWWGLGPW